ncbi:MAG: MATE family efflux transporter [Lachnospiraceae bacterium]|nr:MATE family efflux transporter [Lachnospiraceae bacterium]
MEQSFMKEKPIFRLLISMSVPVMLSMLIQSLYNIVDSMWVARLGTDALTAVSLVFPLQNVIMSVGVGIGVGIGSIISLRLGEGNHEAVNETASTGIALVLIHCVIFVILGLILTRPFIGMFTQDKTVFKWVCDYSYVILCFSFGELLQMCFEKFFQSMGYMKTTMYLMASGCIINIILDPILIFGWFGLPAFGVKGAAMATVIGQIAAFFLYLAVYLKKGMGLHLALSRVSFRLSLTGKIYSIGIPSSLILAMPSVLVAVLNGILSRFGNVYVAFLGLYFKLQTFINMPSNGVVQGMRPLIGYNYGAGEIGRVKKIIKYSLLMVAAIMLTGTIAAIGFPASLLQLFDADGEMLKYGVPAFRILGTGFLFSSAGTVASGVFEALGKGKESLFVSLLRQFIITVPFGFVLSFFLGPTGIWLVFPAAELISAIVSCKMLKSRTDLFVHNKILSLEKSRGNEYDLS